MSQEKVSPVLRREAEVIAKELNEFGIKAYNDRAIAPELEPNHPHEVLSAKTYKDIILWIHTIDSRKNYVSKETVIIGIKTFVSDDMISCSQIKAIADNMEHSYTGTVDLTIALGFNISDPENIMVIKPADTRLIKLQKTLNQSNPHADFMESKVAKWEKKDQDLKSKAIAVLGLTLAVSLFMNAILATIAVFL